MVVKYPCGIGDKAVKTNHKAIQCDLCNKWVHIKCNRIDPKSYLIVSKDECWYCLNCSKTFFPFSTITDLDLYNTLDGKNLNFNKANSLSDNSNLKELFGDLNRLSDTSLDCKYLDIQEYNVISKNHLSYLHLNISSLPYHIDDLRILLDSFLVLPDIIGITESNLHPCDFQITNIDLEGYSYVHTPTEAKKGGALLYIKTGINYKLKKDLNIVKNKLLESIFIEVINEYEKNIIVGCVYKHPPMLPNEFTDDYLSPLIEKISLAKKQAIILGDLNMDLMKFDQNNDISNL